MSSDQKPMRALAERMGVKFKNIRHLDLALTHRSFVHEQKLPLEKSNERLEFLGDAVLGICIAEMLVKQFPQEPEGLLSKRRAALVNQKTLAKLAESLQVGEALKLGKGEEKTGGRKKRSLLCDAFEAIIGAIYLDQGMSMAARYITRVFHDLIPESKKVETSQDYKTRLQEYFQGKYKRSPRYSVVGEKGPDHSKIFEVKVEIHHEILARGVGSSKREAEQDAARHAFYLLRVEDGAFDYKKRKTKKRKKRKRTTKDSKASASKSKEKDKDKDKEKEKAKAQEENKK